MPGGGRGRASARPFPAVFGVLTGGLRAADIKVNCREPDSPFKAREMLRTIALTGFAALVAASTISLAPPARAQIGTIFSDPAPRPPGSIPRGQVAPPSDDDEEVPELMRGDRLLRVCIRAQHSRDHLCGDVPAGGWGHTQDPLPGAIVMPCEEGQTVEGNILQSI